jgi:hypothetical protein
MFHDHLYTYILVLVNKLLNPFVYIMIIFFILYQKKKTFSFFVCYYLCIILLFVSIYFLLKGGAIIFAQIDKEIMNSNTHADIYILSCILCLLVSIRFFCFFFFSCIYETKLRSFSSSLRFNKDI